MDNKDLVTFGELSVWDIFETKTGDYYLKTNLTNGFNTILLTGEHIKCFTFGDDEKVAKFK